MAENSNYFIFPIKKGYTKGRNIFKAFNYLPNFSKPKKRYLNELKYFIHLL